jgi:hypothetical protein
MRLKVSSLLNNKGHPSQAQEAYNTMSSSGIMRQGRCWADRDHDTVVTMCPGHQKHLGYGQKQTQGIICNGKADAQKH